MTADGYIQNAHNRTVTSRPRFLQDGNDFYSTRVLPDARWWNCSSDHRTHTLVYRTRCVKHDYDLAGAEQARAEFMAAHPDVTPNDFDD